MDQMMMTQMQNSQPLAVRSEHDVHDALLDFNNSRMMMQQQQFQMQMQMQQRNNDERRFQR